MNLGLTGGLTSLLSTSRQSSISWWVQSISWTVDAVLHQCRVLVSLCSAAQSWRRVGSDRLSVFVERGRGWDSASDNIILFPQLANFLIYFVRDLFELIWQFLPFFIESFFPDRLILGVAQGKLIFGFWLINRSFFFSAIDFDAPLIPGCPCPWFIDAAILLVGEQLELF